MRTRIYAIGITSAALVIGCGGSNEDLTFGSGSTAGVGAGSSTGNAGGNGQGGNGQGGQPVDAPRIDLRADVNRNGTIDLDDATEDNNEDTWDATHGAVLLANIDDDEKKCPTSGQSDAQYAACHDAADTVINGPDDLEDLARIKTVPWEKAYPDAVGVIAVSTPNRVRLFRKNETGSFDLFDPAASKLNAADLAQGVEFAIEAVDIVRNAAEWDGLVDVSLTATGTGPDGKPMPETTDKLRMRVAPVLFRHHLHTAQRVYVSNTGAMSSTVFRAELTTAAQDAAVPEPISEYNGSDQWTQDFFETAYTSMPAIGGTQHVMHVNFRSANYTNNLRAAGRFVFQLRGKDVAAAVQYDPQHPNSMDTLNSFGNFETVPPFTHNGQTYPLGRVIRGSDPSFYPDTSFDRMVNAQNAQPIIYVDTSWLSVGHIDETITFIKANSPRGWVMGINDPTMAKNMLEKAQASGNGGVQMFVGKFWGGNQSATVTIDEVLADPDVMNESASSAVEVAAQLDIIKQETGITDKELIAIPFLHQPTGGGYSVAYQPGTVNGIYLSDTDFAVAKPHGPNIAGQDIFEAQLVEAFAPYGVKVHFIENWNLYHRLSGEVHCGTNTTRVVPDADRWWESLP